MQITIRVANKRYTNQGEYIGRPAPLGNPFPIGPGASRDDVLKKYDEWLNVMLQDPDSSQSRHIGYLMAKARREGHLTLLCWCAPLPCHGDIIRDVLLERLNV